MTQALILCLVGILYTRYILLLLVYPWQALANRSFMAPNSRLLRLLAIPYRFLLRLTYSGWEKFSAVHVSRLPSKHLRRWAYAGWGGKFGRDVVLRYQAEVWCPYKLIIGQGSIIGYNNLLDARNGIEIGRHVNFSANVSVYTLQHNHRDPLFACNQPGNMRVVIGDRAWIGPNVIILPGVHVGEGAVCAAGCVVTKDVEPFSVVAGIPARKVNERPRDLRYEFRAHESRIY